MVVFPDDHTDLLELPHLKHLNLQHLEFGSSELSMRWPDIFLDLLSLPALTSIAAWAPYTNRRSRWASPNVMGCLINLLARSSCSLKILKIDSMREYDRGQLKSIFKLTLNLLELELFEESSQDVTAGLLEAMTHDPNHASGQCCLLPKLTSVKLSMCKEWYFEDLSKFLASRQSSGSPCKDGNIIARIRTAHIDKWDAPWRGFKPWSVVYEEYRGLQDQGMDLALICKEVQYGYNQRPASRGDLINWIKSQIAEDDVMARQY